MCNRKKRTENRKEVNEQHRARRGEKSADKEKRRIVDGFYISQIISSQFTVNSL